MSNSVKCIIRQEWENRDANGNLIERSGYVYVTNEDGAPHVYDSIKDARAEIRANFGRDANRAGILHSHSVDDYTGNVHDGYIFIVREDTQEYAEAIEQAEQDAAPEYIEPEAIQTVSGNTIYRSTDPVTNEIVFTVAGRDFWTLADARYYAQCNPAAAELEQRAEILAAIEAPALREYFTAEATAHQWTPEETRSAIKHRESIIKANAAALAFLDAYADASGDTLTEDDDPRSREPYQRYELEVFLGEPDDYDVDAIEAEATAYDPKTGRTVWAQGIDLAAIAERHQVATYYPATA